MYHEKQVAFLKEILCSQELFLYKMHRLLLSMTLTTEKEVKTLIRTIDSH